MMRWLYSALLGAMISLLAACGGDATAPATAPAAVSTTAPATATPLPAATATPQPISPTATAPEATAAAPEAAVAAPETNVVVDFWTSDNEPKRVAVYQTLAADYAAAHPGVQVGR